MMNTKVEESLEEFSKCWERQFGEKLKTPKEKFEKFIYYTRRLINGEEDDKKRQEALDALSIVEAGIKDMLGDDNA